MHFLKYANMTHPGTNKCTQASASVESLLFIIYRVSSVLHTSDAIQNISSYNGPSVWDLKIQNE